MYIYCPMHVRITTVSHNHLEGATKQPNEDHSAACMVLLQKGVPESSVPQYCSTNSSRRIVT